MVLNTQKILNNSGMRLKNSLHNLISQALMPAKLMLDSYDQIIID